LVIEKRRSHAPAFTITNYQLQMSQLLLVLDTSGKNGSLALARVTTELGEITVPEVVPLAGGTFSAQLVPQIAALLEKHGYSKNDLTAFVVVNGPGSFTGLRVGLAAVKALAEVLQKPIVVVSLLEAVACRGPAGGRVLAVLDAGRGDVYVGDYEPGARLRGVTGPQRNERLLSKDQLLAEALLPENKMRLILTPDGPLAEALLAVGIQVERIEYPDSAVIARLGWRHLERGETVGPDELEAKYIRQSDAEIFSKPGP
jgi:tRNA threonylcarbamoyladenosine biosynthesis protein TsaB